TEWVIAGASKPEMIDRTRALFASGGFNAPEAASFSFMLSKQGYLNDDAARPWLPHVMLFVPHGQAATWGARLEGSPAVGAGGSPWGRSVFFIPVRRWSDGSPAPPATDLRHKM